jgi:hypothetical protein
MEHVPYVHCPIRSAVLESVRIEDVVKFMIMLRGSVNKPRSTFSFRTTSAHPLTASNTIQAVYNPAFNVRKASLCSQMAPAVSQTVSLKHLQAIRA